VLLGVVRAGVVGDFIPNSVIKGMLAAIGLILILKQFPHLVGYDADFEGDESFLQSDSENTLTEL
jgi:MFS superfamily sulfate permease-like transporter